MSVVLYQEKLARKSNTNKKVSMSIKNFRICSLSMNFYAIESLCDVINLFRKLPK